MVNKVFLLGNLGAAPDVRSANGTPVASLSVATSRSVKKGETWVDETEWHRVTVWGHDADYVGKYAQKGQTAHIEGRLQTRKWKDKDGNDRYTTEVVADRGGVKLIRKGEPTGEGGQGRRQEQEPRGGGRQDQEPAPKGWDDDLIPF